jgi:hypothetical protein
MMAEKQRKGTSITADQSIAFLDSEKFPMYIGINEIPPGPCKTCI